MNAKALLVLLAYLAFAGICYWWWQDKTKNGCTECATAVTNGAAAQSTSLPLSFKWTDTTAIQGEGFATYRTDQIKNLGPTDTLLIKTWYYQGETNGEQLALQRANVIKALYPEVSAERVKVVTEVRPAEDKYKSEQFVAQELSVLPNTKSLVKKSGNNITIYFATNSSAKNVEKEIDDYLTTLAAEMKTNPNESVTINGHTDNVGDDAKNMTLSQSRADFVKGLLQAKGADATKITTAGKGETAPIADNATEDGRKLNRRVELIINKP